MVEITRFRFKPQKPISPTPLLFHRSREILSAVQRYRNSAFGIILREIVAVAPVTNKVWGKYIHDVRRVTI